MPKKVKQGTVVSDKMEKTVVVKVADYKPHPKYKKIMKTTKNYKARDEKSVCKIGDIVSIVESRPLAGSVRWVLSEVVTKAN
ncbi:30S ribosomal protein S17 [Candidatus Gastranaerophilus sp. (ex Termes propinquus)]|nr:30S ribosomal protein S17 [Candidatus Gastranaerophilus sp. (ex Termes propinquus)]